MFTCLDVKTYFFPNRSGTTQEVRRGSGTTHSPFPTLPDTQNSIKKLVFFFESGTSNHYYQVEASSIFVFPRAKNDQNGHKMVKILVRVTLALMRFQHLFKVTQNNALYVYRTRHQSTRHPLLIQTLPPLSLAAISLLTGAFHFTSTEARAASELY